MIGHFGADNGSPRLDPTPVFVGYMTLIGAATMLLMTGMVVLSTLGSLG